MDLSQDREAVLEAFEKSKEAPFIINRVDDHIFIKFNEQEHHFWSPQLHLEIIETTEKKTKLYGLFGPNPGLWTSFVFLHFAIATMFILLGIWAYSNASLKKAYDLQIIAMVGLVLLWSVLYAFGRLGKRKGKPQMKELYRFMTTTLRNTATSDDKDQDGIAIL